MIRFSPAFSGTSMDSEALDKPGNSAKVRGDVDRYV